MSNWRMIPWPFEKYEIEEHTMQVRSRSFTRSAFQGGHNKKVRGHLLSKRPNGQYRLKHCATHKMKMLHPVDLADFTFNRKPLPEKTND